MAHQRHRFYQWFILTLLFLLPAVAPAQEDRDTLPEGPTVTVEPIDQDSEYYDEEDDERASMYFQDRSLQRNGGGPDTIEYRTIPDTVLRRLGADKAFWYVNTTPKKKKRNDRSQDMDEDYEPVGPSNMFQTILWFLIIGGFIAFMVIYLSNSNVGLFRKKSKNILSTEEEEVETDNIFEINYQRELEKAIAKGNYRFAVRLMYLRVLRTMADKSIIQYKHDRTDFDYLMQLYDGPYYHDFFRLTRNYEYTWYGQFDIDSEKFSWIKKDFDSFDAKLNS